METSIQIGICEHIYFRNDTTAKNATMLGNYNYSFIFILIRYYTVCKQQQNYVGLTKGKVKCANYSKANSYAT